MEIILLLCIFFVVLINGSRIRELKKRLPDFRNGKSVYSASVVIWNKKPDDKSTSQPDDA